MKARIVAVITILFTLMVLLVGCSQRPGETIKHEDVGSFMQKSPTLNPQGEFYTIGGNLPILSVVKGKMYKMLWQTDDKVKKVNIELSSGDKKILIASGLTKEKGESKYIDWEYSWKVSEDLPSSADTGQKYVISVYNVEAKNSLRDFPPWNITRTSMNIYVLTDNECPRLKIILPEKKASFQYGNPIQIRLKQENLKDVSIGIYESGKPGGPLGYVRSQRIPVTDETIELDIKNYIDTLQNGKEYRMEIEGRTSKGVTINLPYQLFSFTKFFN
jgi:hypothetical protein